MTKTAKKLNRNGKDILEAIEKLKAIGNHKFLNRTLRFEIQPDESYLL